MLTLQDLIKLIKLRYDPEVLIEILDISTEELCDRFEDKIEEHYDNFMEDLEEDVD